MDDSEIPDNIMSSFLLYRNGELRKAEWMAICGGKDNAEMYERTLDGSMEGSAPSPYSMGPPDEPPNQPQDPPESDPEDPGDYLEEEEGDSPLDSPAPDNMPPVMALIIAFVIAVMYYLVGELTLLGVILFSISFGFSFVGLIWLELLTLPRFSNRSDMIWEWHYWGLLMVVSIAASLTIIVSNHIPGILGEFDMMFSENIDPSPLLEICLIIQAFFNGLIVLSMQGTTDVPRKILRSPWTVGSFASLVTCWFLVEYPSHPWEGDLVLMLFGALIVGASAWVYGRSQGAEWTDILFYALVPSIVGFVILDMSDEITQIVGDNDSLTMISFIALPIILNSISWALPKRASDYTPQDLEGTRLGVIGSSAIILLVVIAAIVMLSYQSETGIIPLLPLAFVYHTYSREHSRKMGGDVLRVHRILPRDPSKIRGFKKVGLKFSLLGPTGTGKTSFATALWTLLREPDNMHIWWSKEVDALGEHKLLRADKLTLQALAERGGCSIEDMMDERISGTTCKEFWQGDGNGIQPGSLPQPGPGSPFPFFAEAFGNSEKILEKYKTYVTDPNPRKRRFPPATSYGRKIEMSVSFHADVEVISPSFLFTKSPMSRSRTGTTTEVELTMETWDIRGESFSAAVNHTREQIHKYGTRRQKKLKVAISQDWMNKHHPHAKPQQVEEARTLFLDSSHSFLLVDIEDLLSGDRKGVKEYLRMMQIINRDGNSNLESLTILMNKADNLLGTSSDMPLEDWSDMNDDAKAAELLNKATNYALDQLKGTGMQVDAKFVCAFGGLIPLMQGPKNKRKPVMRGGKAMKVPPYPLIPVNVIEPLIEVILTARLHSEEI